MNLHHFVVCIDNADYPASLERCKIYQMLPGEQAKQHQYIRVIDESGEDYLYPQTLFIPITLSSELETAIVKAA
ncbi:MAG: hypothetical protein Q8Q54_14935 [Methylococcales bacterium]|nr:hypothetical protein [Methylococcales bacterium]MDP3840212.1 hypothetical protein [Methylococcales bacterium]